MSRSASADDGASRFDPSIDRIRRIADAPLANLRRSGWWIRKTFFTRPRSETDFLRVPRSKPELRSVLGRRYFEPGWETSYQYRREILNYRRVEYDDGRQPPIEWWQTHVRGYASPPYRGEDAPEVELTAHYEPEPVEHPDRHISKRYIDLDHGMAVLRRVLDENGIDYEYVPSRG